MYLQRRLLDSDSKLLVFEILKFSSIFLQILASTRVLKLKKNTNDKQKFHVQKIKNNIDMMLL